ncbi:TadE family type IV pilus minor pilin [Cryptosporangium minutisporangium]|uniref:Pilus assembly protein TadE n=1 Tax=Cryptosporangium minutisporangium TaxID=113569 RepID=A0ABP6SWC7_9ACTN
MTAELAAAIPVVVFLLTAGLTALTATTTQLRCVDAARETARAAARGDPDAAAAGQRVAPTGATVRLTRDDEFVRVTVSAPLPAVGRVWPGRIVATAVAEPEPPALP